MMISSTVDRNKRIISANYSGPVNLEDIEEFYLDVSQKYSNWKTLKIIQDERNADFVGTPEILKNAKKLTNILIRDFHAIRIAVIQDRPVETAYSFLFSENALKINHQIRIFSVRENAITWLESQ